MTPDGRFRMPERPPLSVRIARTALIVALLAGVLATALLALWFALVLIPVALVAAVVAWVAFKLRGGLLRPR